MIMCVCAYYMRTRARTHTHIVSIIHTVHIYFVDCFISLYVYFSFYQMLYYIIIFLYHSTF